LGPAAALFGARSQSDVLWAGDFLTGSEVVGFLGQWGGDAKFLARESGQPRGDGWGPIGRGRFPKQNELKTPRGTGNVGSSKVKRCAGARA